MITQRRALLMLAVVKARSMGKSYAAIAEEFNAAGLPTMGRGRWHPATVRTLFLEAVEVSACRH